MTRRVIGRYLDALNSGDLDAVAECVSDDFLNEHTSALGHSVRGREAYRGRLGEFLARFAGLRYVVEEVIAEGDRAAVAYRMSFRWQGSSGTPRPVSIRGMFRFRVVDGAIAHRVDYWDSAEFERQVS